MSTRVQNICYQYLPVMFGSLFVITWCVKQVAVNNRFSNFIFSENNFACESSRENSFCSLDIPYMINVRTCSCFYFHICVRQENWSAPNRFLSLKLQVWIIKYLMMSDRNVFWCWWWWWWWSLGGMNNNGSMFIWEFSLNLAQLNFITWSSSSIKDRIGMNGPGVVLRFIVTWDQMNGYLDWSFRCFLIKGNVSLDSNGIKRSIQDNGMTGCVCLFSFMSSKKCVKSVSKRKSHSMRIIENKEDPEKQLTVIVTVFMTTSKMKRS